MADIKKIDVNFDNKETKKDLKYYNPKTCDNIKVYGCNWFEQDKRFIRFPAYSDDVIANLPGAEGLKSLVEQTSGVMLAFYSNTTTLKIKVKLGTIFNMGHMAFTGQGGVDCYIGNNLKDLTYYRTASYNIYNKEYEFTYFENYKFGDKLYVLNLPLYSGVQEIEVGTDEEAWVKPALDIFTNGKIVVYGTSVTQGGCASRPGINYTNALSRRMNYEFLNYGFSGNGRGQKEVVDLLCSIDDVKMYILAYEANATLPMLQATLENFIDSIRKKYPTVPILLVSKIRMSVETHQIENYKGQLLRLKYQKGVVKAHQAAGDKNIYFYDGHKLFGKYTTEATVDGCHPTDLGFMMITEHLEKEVNRILNIK